MMRNFCVIIRVLHDKRANLDPFLGLCCVLGKVTDDKSHQVAAHPRTSLVVVLLQTILQCFGV